MAPAPQFASIGRVYDRPADGVYTRTLPMLPTSTLRCGWAVLLVALFSSTVWAKPKIAVLGIETIGAMTPQQTDVAKELTGALRSRASSSGKFVYAPNSKRELVDEKLMNNCSTEALSC